ncbi:MAG: hypothetical protein CMO36_05055 [Verrucomicrobiaceae bacterium]|nr:hypothetical protein [Verrucomicrobiaceae bacterium]
MSNLTIGYSSIRERVAQIRLPEFRPDVEIIIAVQGGFVEGPDRDDVRMIYLDSLGAAKSRNVILKEAKGRYLVFGDDDMEWKDEGLTTILELFEHYEDLDLTLCQSENELGILRKRYRKKRRRLSKFNSAKAATYEITIRLSSFREKNITFNEGFGAGEKNFLGDEYIFISEACAAGLNCEFIPTTIAIHPSVSSGMIYGTLEDTEARSNVFQEVFDRFSIVVRIGFALKNLFRFRNPLLILRFIFRVFPKG